MGRSVSGLTPRDRPDSQRPSCLWAFLLPPAHPSPLGLSDEGGGAWNTWPGRLGGRAHLLFEHDSRGRLQVGAGALRSASGCSGVGGSRGESLMLSAHLPSLCSLRTALPGRTLQGLCTHKALSRTPPPLGGFLLWEASCHWHLPGSLSSRLTYIPIDHVHGCHLCDMWGTCSSENSWDLARFCVEGRRMPRFSLHRPIIPWDQTTVE